MGRVLSSAALGCATLLIGATVLPLFRSRHWAVRAFDFPRLQIAFGSGLWAAAALARYKQLSPGEKRLLVATAGALATQVVQILPYTRFGRTEVLAAKGKPDLRILTANVLQTNRRTDVVKRLIQERQPDIVLLTETDGWWCDQMALLKDSYPWVVTQAQDNTYGMLLYSRLELIEPEVRFLVKKEIPSIRTRVRLPKSVEGSAREIWLYAVHPEPPASLKPDHTPRGSGPRDVELLLLAEELKDLNEPVIVVGDFNDVAWSHTTRLFKRLSRLLDPRRGRGMFNTFHASYPPLRYPLDHLFHSEHMVLIDFERLAHTGSDHFPIYAELKLSPSAPQVQEQAEPDSSDVKEADAVIEEAPRD
jgi:endonuclease/exonuclease/phosphatase (EEP) superfamily protein YafD